MAATIWVVRHGDRFDFDVGKEVWEGVAQSINDPVLSDLGRKQAEQTARVIFAASKHPITRVVTSPFVRCLETANPIAGLAGAPILIDESLFEVVYTKEEFPPLSNRARYFPRISLDYCSGPRPAVDESFPKQAMVRYAEAARTLASKFSGENIVLVTHAAGVSAIVAALCRITVREVGPVSPASIFCLSLAGEGGDYSIVPGFNGIISHFEQPMGKTLPWPRDSDTTDEWGGGWIKEGETAAWLTGRGDCDDKLR